MWKNLFVRTLTGALFVAIILVCIWFQPYYCSFDLLFGLITVVGLYEFYRMVNLHPCVHVPIAYLLCCGIVLYFGCWWMAFMGGDVVLVAYGLMIILLIVAELFRKQEKPMDNLALSLTGQALVAVPFSLLNFLAPKPQTGTENELIWLLALFVLLWIFDTGAYLVGISCGKHKMCPHISPKKSWEGEAGGVVFTLVGAWVFSRFQPSYPPWEWLGFGLLIAVFGTFGDLSESQMKRAAGVKDSGKLLPGHGGVLDRFDSLLLSVPVAYVYLQYLTQL